MVSPIVIDNTGEIFSISFDMCRVRLLLCAV